MPRPNAIQRFEKYHKAMVKHGQTIPHWVLRDYLDTLLLARRAAPGLHNKTITVTRNAPAGLLNWDVMIEEGVAIRIEGQKYVYP